MIRRILIPALLLVSSILSAANPTLLDLKDVSLLRDWFQKQNGSVRVVVLLSPGCLSCLKGFAGIQETLRKIQNPNLRVAVVWLPLTAADKREDAVKHSTLFTDGRLAYFWDPYRAAGETWQSALKLKGAAWDVYLVYDASAKWNDTEIDPAPPSFWMHQLKEVPQAPVFDQKVLEEKIRALLK